MTLVNNILSGLLIIIGNAYNTNFFVLIKIRKLQREKKGGEGRAKVLLIPLYILYIQGDFKHIPPARPRPFPAAGRTRDTDTELVVPMKINDNVRNRGIRIPKKELADNINEAKRTYGRKWLSATKADLRFKYRKYKKATIDLKMTGMSPEDRPIIMASILARGSVQMRFNTCGKPDCPCSKGGKKHGPYWYLSLPMPADHVRKGSPRMRHFYITQEEAKNLKERIDNFRKLQDQVWFELFDDFENGDSIDDLIEK